MRVTSLLAAFLSLSVGCSSSETPGGNDLAMSVGGGEDMAMSADLAACTPNTVACVGDVLVVCGADGGVPATTQCPFGCEATGAAAHCARLVPTQPVTMGDLTIGGLVPTLATAGTYVFDTAKGGITDSAGNVVRDANASFSPGAAGEVHQGIFFRTIETNIVVWAFADLTVAAGAQVIFSGGARVAIVSQGALHVSGVIDARGYDFSGATPVLCASNIGGPGGSTGGTATMAGGPSSTGGAGSVSGGGGGGDGDVGGNGGGGTAGGMIRGTQTLTGGLAFPGAGGGGPTGVGGGAGGGLQFAVLGPVVLDGTAGARGGIDVGGCGGKAAGGGGGAGGEVLIEAATVELHANGGIAANGGGGGGSAGDGQPGALSTTAASGGTGGGAGGVTGRLAGGTSATAGGGGGSGRIRLSTRSGTATIDSGAVLSPGLADKNSAQESTATEGAATLQ